MFNTPNHQPIISVDPKTPTKKGHFVNVNKNVNMNDSVSRQLFFETIHVPIRTIRELIEPSINSNIVGSNENVDDCASSS